ncbi:uncharacterized protein LOC125943110 [Dermacentor silvarum]|uniref:uncharacterized protein LOC125943110 n=1 Tax=Dermacentor silvarum TaxID=543639 RepID=UPI002100E732|nr:uncharacterized protein LOC125943110 [Dermacentor silvarum]
MLELADQFLEAQGGTNLSKIRKEEPGDAKKPASDERRNPPKPVPRCYLCNRLGHHASSCRTNFTRPNEVKCFKCGRTGHKADSCRNGVKETPQASCVYAPPKHQEDINDGFVELRDGKRIPVVNAVMTQRPEFPDKVMPVLAGKLGDKQITVLRDSGTSTVIVRRDLVQDEELTGETTLVCLVDGTARKLPEAKIEVDTPYYSGKVTALCMDHPLYDLIIGNVEGVRAPDDPKPLEEEPKTEPSTIEEARGKPSASDENTAAAVTRAQAKAQAKPSQLPSRPNSENKPTGTHNHAKHYYRKTKDRKFKFKSR